MPGSHPFFNVNNFFDFTNFRSFGVVFLKYCFRFVMTFEVAPKVLQKCHFLLQFFRVLSQCVLFTHILPITWSSLHVIKVMPVRIQDDFGWIIEEDSSSIIWQIITEAIFGRVINPFFYPNLCLSGLNDSASFIAWLSSLELSIRVCNFVGYRAWWTCSLSSGSIVGAREIVGILLSSSSVLELPDVSMRGRTSQGWRRQCSWNRSLFVEPWMHTDFINIWSSTWIVVENLGDQVSRLVWNLHSLWEWIVVHSDALVGRFHIICFERWLTNNKRVNDDTEWPDVNLVGVTLFAL